MEPVNLLFLDTCDTYLSTVDAFKVDEIEAVWHIVINALKKKIDHLRKADNEAISLGDWVPAECLEDSFNIDAIIKETKERISEWQSLSKQELTEKIKIQLTQAREQRIAALKERLSEQREIVEIPESDAEERPHTPTEHSIIDLDAATVSPLSPQITETHETHEDVHKEWKKTMLIGMKELLNHRHGPIFASPVREEEAPSYYSIIKQPQCLNQIRARIREDELKTTEQVHLSLLTLFYNAIVYNGPGTLVYDMAMEMMQVSESMIESVKKKLGLVQQQDEEVIQTFEGLEFTARSYTELTDGDTSEPPMPSRKRIKRAIFS